MALVKYILLKVITIVFLGTIYVMVIAEGFRVLMSPLAMKLWKVPFLTFLRDYRETKDLDLALCFAPFVFFFVWWLWEKVLLIALCGDQLLRDSGWNPETYKRIAFSLAAVILIGDALLFYLGVTQFGWRGGGLSLPALLGTAVYVAVIVAISFLGVNYRRQFMRF